MWRAKYQDWLFTVSCVSRQGKTENKVTKTVQTSKYGWNVLTLRPLKVASNFSLQYHPWVKHESNENRGDDHQPKVRALDC